MWKGLSNLVPAFLRTNDTSLGFRAAAWVSLLLFFGNNIHAYKRSAIIALKRLA